MEPQLPFFLPPPPTPHPPTHAHHLTPQLEARLYKKAGKVGTSIAAATQKAGSAAGRGMDRLGERMNKLRHSRDREAGAAGGGPSPSPSPSMESPLPSPSLPPARGY